MGRVAIRLPDATTVSGSSAGRSSNDQERARPEQFATMKLLKAVLPRKRRTLCQFTTSLPWETENNREWPI